MKTQYSELELEVVEFEETDIITESPNSCPNEGEIDI
jgi:hypothetical protein